MNPSASPDYSILAAFNQPVTRPRPSILYQTGLVLVAITMVLLPLIYLALIGLVACGVFYHAFYHWEPIMTFGGTRGGRAGLLKLFFYVAPLVIGAGMVFFMLKPLFARRPARAQPLALNPASEPLLYAFIEKICEKVGAPSPKRIDLDCQLNASAAFRRGILSMGGNDMVLTIGLPLIANFSAAEFAGVVAHEFGHFAQGLGMRLSYVIHSVNVWFARVAYERDVWDEELERLSIEEESVWVTLLIMLTQGGIWFSRCILKILMFIGFFVSGFMSRQMEYNADAYQLKIVGTDIFEKTHRKLATLSEALELTYTQIAARWKNYGQLPDNMCELLRRAHENLPPAVHKKIDDTLGLESTGFFDTHPSPADRIRAGRRAGEPGIFHDDRPATALFASFDHPARFVTLLHYTDDLDIPITEGMLVHVESEPGAVGSRTKDPGIVDEYFLGILPLILPLRISTPVQCANYESDAAELESLSVSLKNITEQLAPIKTQFIDATKKIILARAAVPLIECGATFHASDFFLDETTVDAARASEAEAVAVQESLRHSIREVAAALGRKLQLGLSLKLAERAGADKILELVNALNRDADEHDRHHEVMMTISALDRIMELKQAAGETPALSKAIAAQTEVLRNLIDKSPAVSSGPAKQGLQISKRPMHTGTREVDELRMKTVQWIAAYLRRIEELVRLVQSAEEIPA